MNLSQTKDKYFGRIVKHPEHLFLFEVIDVYQIGSQPIMVRFKTELHHKIPTDRPKSTTLTDLEESWTVLV